MMELEFNLMSYGLGLASGFALALAVGRSKFARLQAEAREQADNLTGRIRDLRQELDEAYTKLTTKTTTRKRK